MSAIALVGNLALDRVAGAAPRPGGGVFHGARAAARVGADAAVATRCAPADRNVVLAQLEALRIPVTCADARETTAFSFHYEGDERVMTVDAVGDSWTEDDLAGWAAPVVRGARWVLVAGLLRSHFPLQAVEALARDGRRLLLDAQGLVRLARTGPLARDGEVDRRILRCLAVLKVSENEGRILAGALEPEALRALGVPEVVLTLGSRGALVVERARTTAIPPRPAPVGADPTGAGDAFSLVYLDGRARELSPVEAAHRAAEVVADLLTA